VEKKGGPLTIGLIGANNSEKIFLLH